MFDPPINIDDLLDSKDPEYNWLVPGLMEYGDRLIVTGSEGGGKSTFLRQFALQIASGLKPLTAEPIEPKKVLLIDLENSKPQVRRAMRAMRERIDHPVGDMLQVTCWPQGIDLANPGDAAEVAMVLRQTLPDLLIIGPMYKMMGQDLGKEEVSNHMAMQLDAWRALYGFSIIMESHQPHESVSKDGRWRPERPYGSSLWMRWPETGICIEKSGVLRHWRGQREERDWPDRIYWGKDWPWEAGAGRCLHCGIDLVGNQVRFCSERHSNAWRQSKYRSVKRSDVGVEDDY